MKRLSNPLLLLVTAACSRNVEGSLGWKDIYLNPTRGQDHNHEPLFARSITATHASSRGSCGSCGSYSLLENQSRRRLLSALRGGCSDIGREREEGFRESSLLQDGTNTALPQQQQQAKIDEDLYSRQLYVMGKSAMAKMGKADVLISGLRSGYMCPRQVEGGRGTRETKMGK